MTLQHDLVRPAIHTDPPGSAVDPIERDTVVLFRRLHVASPEQRPHIRAEIVALNLPLAVRLTRRYLHRGMDAEDLQQVAAIGLVKALNRDDPDRGRPFFGYLIPTVQGELKRHFRDHGWDVHVPRGLQERCLVVARARATSLSACGARPPSRRSARWRP